MDDFNHQYHSSVPGGGGNPNLMTTELHQTHIPGIPVSLGSSSMPAAFSGIGYFTAFHDPQMFSVPKTQRSRRKSTSGFEAVKHRRTRSGCFMCRSRRVKCDETRPICERCKKGSRECIYPELGSSKGPVAQSGSKETSQMTSPGSSTGADDGDQEVDSKLEPILDEEEEDAVDSEAPNQTMFPTPVHSATSPPSFAKSSTRQSSETPSYEDSKSSPAGSTGTASSHATNIYQPLDPALFSSSARADWSHLPPDFQHYLDSFCENITSYHYCIPSDPDNFFAVTLPNIASRNEALLNAVVGFSAYHETLKTPNGQVEDFLKYYNKSVVLLLASLRRREPQTVATILTVLQLATIEEYLGDWINITGHQKAALQILTNLFTPEIAMQSPVSRMIVSWYTRFDVFAGLMGGFRTALPREWFTTFLETCQDQRSVNPANIGWKTEEASARLRLISMDMSILYAQGHRGEITHEDYRAEYDEITKRLEDWKQNLDPSLIDPAYSITSFPNRRPLDENDIVDPYAPGILYQHPLLATTLLTSEWNSVIIMHKSQSATPQREKLYAELAQHSYAICQIFEALERWPDAPQGVLMLTQACLAISALFLPPDERHRNWIKRKFALVETFGYIHPITLRSKMSELLGDPSCVRWWLPNDEGFTPILQSTRNFADERNAVAVSAQMENLREVRHVFTKLQLNDLDTGSPSEASKGKAPAE